MQDCKDLYDFLLCAKKRPHMFVQNHSLKELESQVIGYSSALWMHGIQEFGTNFRQRFGGYLLSHHDLSPTCGWAHAITDVNPTPKAAWDHFFELLEAFKAFESDQGSEAATDR